jgi:hypothetical protein
MARSALDVSRIECVACGRLGFGYVVNAPPPKGGGFRLRLKAGSVRHSADSSHIEVVVWFGWRLVLDVLDPYLVSDVSAACYPVPPGSEVLAPVPFAQYAELTQQFVGASSLQILHGPRHRQTRRN